MKLKDIILRLESVENRLHFGTEIFSPTELKIDNLRTVREILESISDINIFNPEISTLRLKTPFLKSGQDEVVLGSFDADFLIKAIDAINLKIKVILDFWRELFTSSDDAVDIRLPDLQNFTDLENVGRDLKLSIEYALNSLHIENNIKIIAAEPGSIWLNVSLGSTIAVAFFGKICKIAAVFLQDLAKAKAFEEYARSLKLNNDAMENFNEQAKRANDLLIDNYAMKLLEEENIMAEGDMLNSLKLSIETIGGLMEKGANFLPQSKDMEIKNSFPLEKELDFIKENLKKLGNSE